MKVLKKSWVTATIFLLSLSPLANAGQAKSSWEEEWKRTLEGAKKEGQVTVYTKVTASNWPLRREVSSF